VRKKNAKLERMRIEEPAVEPFVWDGKEIIYFDGGTSGLPEQVKEGGTVLDPKKAAKVIDCTMGAWLESVFCLIPSGESNGICTPKTYGALLAWEKKSKVSKKPRGIKRLPQGNPKYVTVGTKPCRNSPGLIDGMSVLRTMPKVHKEISSLLVRIEQRAEKYIPTLDLMALAEAKKLGRYQGFSLAERNAGESTIWPSIAYGRNVFLPLHTDQDYFLSATMIFTNRSTSNEVLGYFCFPTKGISVALRNGNVLLFNPQVPHCLSSPCKPVLEIFCLSAYIKSLVVSGNTNI
jgi:hypothetical protein